MNHFGRESAQVRSPVGRVTMVITYGAPRLSQVWTVAIGVCRSLQPNHLGVGNALLSRTCSASFRKLLGVSAPNCDNTNRNSPDSRHLRQSRPSATDTALYLSERRRGNPKRLQRRRELCDPAAPTSRRAPTYSADPPTARCLSPQGQARPECAQTRQTLWLRGAHLSSRTY